MILGLDIDYQKINKLESEPHKPPAAEIFSKQSALFISSNSTDVTIPKWDKINKKLSFDMISPSESYNGILTEKFFTMYIPDYLIDKWWNLSRAEVENNLGTLIHTVHVIRHKPVVSFFLSLPITVVIQ